MSENTETKQMKERKPHPVKTIGKTTNLVTCHFSETSRETLQDKLKRIIINDCISGKNCLNDEKVLDILLRARRADERADHRNEGQV